GPFADAVVEAFLLDRLHLRIAPRRALQPLLLVARHVVPVVRDRPEDAALVGRQLAPGRLRRLELLGIPRAGLGPRAGGRERERRRDQPCGLLSHERKSW